MNIKTEFKPNENINERPSFPFLALCKSSGSVLMIHGPKTKATFLHVEHEPFVVGDTISSCLFDFDSPNWRILNNPKITITEE